MSTLPALPPVPEAAELLACDAPYGPLQAAQPLMFAEALDWALAQIEPWFQGVNEPDEAWNDHRDAFATGAAAYRLRLRSLARQLREGT